jgi:copper homeostasis protein
VESAQQALVAEKNGADRIELCAHLEWDGLTPSEALINETLSLITIPVMAMVRSRKGDFVYSPDELRVMIDSVALLEKAGVHGIVFGSLMKNNEINLDALHRISAAAPHLPLTFHKAIDVTPDPERSLKYLAKENLVSTVLTSGGKGSAWENREVLKRMVAFGKDHQITVLVAGGVRHDNLSKLHDYVLGTAYHGRKIVPGL